MIAMKELIALRDLHEVNMADNRQEIEILKRKIEQANSEINKIRKEVDNKLKKELSRMRQEMDNTSSEMQNDFADKLQRIQDTFSEAYLAETERMRSRYRNLTDQVKQYEEELSKAIQKLEDQQQSLIREHEKKNREYERAARESLDKLQKDIEEACTLPVEVFYPHSIQRYLDAGIEAKRLLELELFSLAATKADCASMAVNRVKEETQSQIDKLETLFGFYRMEFDAIEDSIKCDSNRCLYDGDDAVLELSELDMDFWSDQLFSELQTQLDEHKRTLDMGIDGWIQKCDGQALDPMFLLDKEMQKLELIPNKLGICISYALSACDCFNYTHILADKLEQILNEQNYEFIDVKYGECKCGNDATKGFNWYYDQYLHNEVCVTAGQIPDYREERVLTFKKRHLHGVDSDYCKVYIVPYRTNSTVAYKVYLKLESEYIPQMMRNRLINLFAQNGIIVEATERGENFRTVDRRPFSLQAILQEGLVAEESIGRKYSFD